MEGSWQPYPAPRPSDFGAPLRPSGLKRRALTVP